MYIVYEKFIFSIYHMSEKDLNNKNHLRFSHADTQHTRKVIWKFEKEYKIYVWKMWIKH